MTLAVRFVLTMLLALATVYVRADDWYRWRGPDLNGISQETNWTIAWPKEGPKQLWKASVGMGFSSMTVANGRLYTMGNKENEDTIYCFDADTGALIWKHSYPCVLDPRFYEGGTLSTPTVDGSHVYTISKRGDAFCFEAATGKIRWQKHLIQELGLAVPSKTDNWWGFAGSPLVRGDLLIFNAASDGTALNRNDGKVVWSNGKNFSGYATPVPFRQNGINLLALAVAESIVAVGEQDGMVLWRYPWKTAYNVNAPDPIISGDRIFVSSYRHGCVLLQMKGASVEKVYENRHINNHLNACVLIGGFLYGIDGDAGYAGGVACLDFATGNLRWSEKSTGTGALMAAGNKLIILGEKGELVIAEASPKEFKPLARAQVLGGKCWTTPVLANGRIYCRNSKGELVALDVRGGR
jgi:outer membrane protein assembly factor BamB